MANQALYRKWRSQTFDQVIGQDHVTRTLKNALEADRIGHAYLFTGPRGTGKTSTARLLAKAVNCVGEGPRPCNECTICQAITEGRLMDLIEIDAASNTSVDDIRDLRDKIDFRPSEAEVKFYIIDEVHMLSKSAFNALLKTLEEPPPHVIFVLATTEPDRIPATIMSRCQRFDFKRISVEAVAAWLQHIITEEGLQAEPTALTYIARQGGGSMRDSISLLDQLTAYGGHEITLELVHSVLGAVNAATVAEFAEALLAKQVSEGLSLINKVVGDGVEPKQFTLEVLEYLRAVLLVKHGQGEQVLNLPAETVTAMQSLAEQVSGLHLLKATQRLNETLREFRFTASEAMVPQLPLELVFVELAFEPVEPEVVPAVAVSAGGFAQSSGVAQTAQPAAKTTPTAFKSTPDKVTPSQSESAGPPRHVDAPREVVAQLTKDQLRQHWISIVKRLPKPHGTYLTVQYIDDVEINGSTIHIFFKPEYGSAAARLKKSKRDVEAAFQAQLGEKWGVEFHIQNKNKATDSGSEAVLDEPLLRKAIDLGGKVVDG